MRVSSQQHHRRETFARRRPFVWILPLLVLLSSLVGNAHARLGLLTGRIPKDNEIGDGGGGILRRLTKLIGYGASPDQSRFPLQLCEGDCDTDDQCDEGLICWQREIGEAVPGCDTNGPVMSRTDYCIDPKALLAPTISPTYETNTIAPTFLGEHGLNLDDDATVDNLEDDDDDIEIVNATLIHNNNTDIDTTTPVIVNAWNFADEPTASPTFEFRGPPRTNAPTNEEWTYLVNYYSDPVPLIFVGNDGDYQAPYPLGPCQADCDSDDDCLGNLVCFQREGGEPVPGCLGQDRGRSDYCVFPHHLEAAFPEYAVADEQQYQNGFQVKLYWEEGYRWQNETFERKWCVTRNYTGSPITGECWYGDTSTACNETELYIDRCSHPEEPDPTQLFDFIPVSDDEVMIQAYGEDRCWHRYRRNITLTTCDPTSRRQRWFAVRGGFNEPRFELSQRPVFNYCVNQDHHPKPGEVVKMFYCDMVRSPDHETSWWDLYV